MQPPRSLIIARPDRLGDVIISSSCLRAVRQKFPDARLYFLAREFARPLFQHHPELDGFLTAPVPVEAIVHLHPEPRLYRAARAIPVRIGYRCRLATRYLTHALPDRRALGTKHEAACNFDLLARLGIQPPAELRPNIRLPDSARDSLARKLPWPLDCTDFAVLNPSAYSRRVRWPAERFVALARKLPMPVVVIGADAADTVSVPGAVNLAGQTDVAELGWLLRYARVLVTRDTGPSHLAAAVDCPVVVIFGRTAPRYGPTRWRPLGERVVVVEKSLPRRPLESQHRYWRRCFAAISVEEVFAAVQSCCLNFARR
jgi:ADP-heptose:LPS heptosyltransferase